MRSVLGLLIALVVAVACQPATISTPSPGPTASLDTPAPPTAAELEAIRFRTDFGLRADLAFVRAVALNPAASSEPWSVPLLPAEIAELNARQSNAVAVRDVIAAEARLHPEDSCGRYIDNQNGGAFTSMWRANLEAHRLAILLKVGPSARLAFRSCTFSEAELGGVMDRITAADASWMATIPAILVSSGVDTIGNRIEMEISSAAPDAADLVRQHYLSLLSLPPEILAVSSDGTGAVLVPWGTVSARVVGRDGKPPGENDWGFFWTSTLAGLECGVGDMGFGVSWDGTPSSIPCQAGTWTIRVMTAGTTLGSAKVVVVAGATVKVTIKVGVVPTLAP